MPKVDHPAAGPHDNTQRSKLPSSLTKPECFLILFLLFAVISASLYLRHFSTEQITSENDFNALQLRTAYTGAKIEDGELWLLNRQETRRRRSLWGERRRRAVHGMARDCGHSCFFKLRQSGRSDMRIRLVRWLQLPKPRNKSLPVLENSRLRPIVQYIESDDAMLARVSRFVPDCLYSAHVEGAKESSIVNLCDVHGGLFGTLALPDGTYLIEPVEERRATAKLSGPSPWSHKPHLVYKSRSHSFHGYDYSTASSPTDASTNLLPDETHFTTAHINASIDDEVFREPDDWIDINR